jgi:hypothetical protein
MVIDDRLGSSLKLPKQNRSGYKRYNSQDANALLLKRSARSPTPGFRSNLRGHMLGLPDASGSVLEDGFSCCLSFPFGLFVVCFIVVPRGATHTRVAPGEGKSIGKHSFLEHRLSLVVLAQVVTQYVAQRRSPSSRYAGGRLADFNRPDSTRGCPRSASCAESGVGSSSSSRPPPATGS